MDERSLISMLTRDMVPNPKGVLAAAGDDCAVIEAGEGRVFLVTTDILLDGVHFSIQTSAPEEIGHKALAVNLSDIAAMGGVPRHAFLTLALPEDASDAFAEGFQCGFSELAREFRVNLLGGDLSRSAGSLVINVTLIGEAAENRVLYRSGAGVGDQIYVTGNLGNAAAGLELLGDEDGPPANDSGRTMLESAQLTPEPRVQQGEFLAATDGVTACIDLSDGLGTDLAHLCRASDVGARVHGSAIPISDDLLEHVGGNPDRALTLALTGGEDYELCITVDAEAAEQVVQDYSARFSQPLIAIGETIETANEIHLIGPGGKTVPLPRGFDHFQENS